MLAFLAAHTNRIRLTTAVLVLGYHHPLEIAKRFGTLDLLSGGRLLLGVGVGSLAAEFEMLDVAFEGRGERADDAIAALRASSRTPNPQLFGRPQPIGIRLQSFVIQFDGGRAVRPGTAR